MVENLKNIKSRYILILLFIFILIQALFLFQEFNIEFIGPILVLFSNIIFLFIIALILKKNKIDVKSLIKNPFSSIKWYKLLGITIITTMFSFGIIILTDYLFPPSIEENLLELSQYQHILVLPIFFIIAVFLAPIIEEIIFRGFLLQRWIKKWNTTIAILLSSAIFALFHLDPIGSLIFGIVMSLLFLKTKNLMVPIIAHAINNFITMFPFVIHKAHIRF